MESRNDDLIGQIELLRAKQMGVIGGVGGSDDDDESSCVDESSSDSDTIETDDGLAALAYDTPARPLAEPDTAPNGFINSSQLIPSNSQLAYESTPNHKNGTPTRSKISSGEISFGEIIGYGEEKGDITKVSTEDAGVAGFGGEVIREGLSVKCLWDRGACKSRFESVQVSTSSMLTQKTGG
jgi:hypothetical protein